jgi:hypothetical protein
VKSTRPLITSVHGHENGYGQASQSDEFADLSDQEKAKLDAFEAEHDRHGKIAIERPPEGHRFLSALLLPHAVRKACGRMLLNEGAHRR